MSDALGLVLSFVYVLAVVGLAEGLRRSGRISFDLSRKMIHIGIGSWILPTVLLFRSPWIAALPPAVFVVLNFLSYRFRWTQAMDAEAGENVGTVLFPLAFVILLMALWNVQGGRAATAGAILTLAWGDAAAALVGLRWGRHRYRVGPGWRSLEGSTAMLLFSAAGIAVAGLLVGARPYAWTAIAAGSAAATSIEAVSRRGMDNLLVPLGTAAVLWGMSLLPP